MAENGKRDEDLDLLLPWYVNGTLSVEEQQAVEAYLESNAHARDEVALLAAMRQQVKEESIENSPGELGLKRLRREISLSEQQAPAPAETGKVVSIASWWRPLAVAACLAVVIQAGVIVTGGPDGEVDTAKGFRPAVLQVTFAPDATEQQIREVLQAAGTSIAGGPSALGIYDLSLQATDGGSAEIEAALAALRARGDVVTFAERN
ncbi:hypothetical protein [Pelagibius sp.]|uniref:hypothetical protein n=1 Tax=Pelagibius sp. TaxID=1931238 RepID=UPI0026234DD7|nr:hypothetical protein [Pelagibius sp.]